jgi:hypothetical protein
MRNLQTGFARVSKKSFFLVIFLSLSFSLLAQKTLSGKVSDNSGAPLSGVSVIVKGTSRGTTTNATSKKAVLIKKQQVIAKTILIKG